MIYYGVDRGKSRTHEVCGDTLPLGEFHETLDALAPRVAVMRHLLFVFQILRDDAIQREVAQTPEGFHDGLLCCRVLKRRLTDTVCTVWVGKSAWDIPCEFIESLRGGLQPTSSRTIFFF